MENLSGKEISKLKEISNEIRRIVVDVLYKIGPEHKGHPGPAFSIAELMACLYFNIMNIDPEKPKWSERDRFILSKGHACPALYAALALRGFFNIGELYTLRQPGSILQGHPDMKRTPGIDMTSGSLGHGLGAGLGMALSARIDKKDYRTFVIVGDGEMQEGIIWESIMYAGHMGLNNLVMIIDRNRWQSCNSIDCTLDIEPLSVKLSSFNWNCISIDGHNIKAIIDSLSIESYGKPLAVIANTIKGKGISFMEEDNSWHQKALTKEQYDIAISELKRSDKIA